MIIRPRYTLLAGALFVGVGTVYGIVSHDPVGTTMLLCLGIAMGLMSYVLIAGSTRGDEQ
jgi:hypothetical protein